MPAKPFARRCCPADRTRARQRRSPGSRPACAPAGGSDEAAHRCWTAESDDVWPRALLSQQPPLSASQLITGERSLQRKRQVTAVLDENVTEIRPECHRPQLGGEFLGRFRWSVRLGPGSIDPQHPALAIGLEVDPADQL